MRCVCDCKCSKNPTLKSESNGEINVNKLFYLTPYIQNIIILAHNQYLKVFMRHFTFLFSY